MKKKEELRKYYKHKRSMLSDEKIDVYSSSIAKSFLENFLEKGVVFHVFKNMKKFNEVDTSFIIESLLHLGKTVALPKMNKDDLFSCQIEEKQRYKTNSFGVQEPNPCIEINSDKIDIIIVPLLICDKEGYRIGYGGGFYDRFLNDLNAIKVGINFFKPLENVSFKEEHDISLDYLITPDLFIKF